MDVINTMGFPQGFSQYGGHWGGSYRPANITNVSTTSRDFSLPKGDELTRGIAGNVLPQDLGGEEPVSKMLDMLAKNARDFLFSQKNDLKKLKLERIYSEGNSAACMSLDNRAVLLHTLYSCSISEEKKEKICSIARDLCEFVGKHEMPSDSAFVLWTDKNGRNTLDDLDQRILTEISNKKEKDWFPVMLENMCSIFFRLHKSNTGMSTQLSDDDWAHFTERKDAAVKRIREGKYSSFVNIIFMKIELTRIHAWVLDFFREKGLQLESGCPRDDKQLIDKVQPTLLTSQDSSVKEKVHHASVEIESDSKKKRNPPSLESEGDDVITSDVVSESVPAYTDFCGGFSPLQVLETDIMAIQKRIETSNDSSSSSKKNAGEIVSNINDETAMMSYSLISADNNEVTNDEGAVSLYGWSDISRIERDQPFSHSHSNFLSALPTPDTSDTEVTKTDSIGRPVFNGLHDFEKTQRQPVIDESGRIDMEAPLTAANPVQLPPSVSSPISSAFPFYRGIHFWPKDGRGVIPEIDMETTDVNIKEMIKRIENKPDFWRSGNIGAKNVAVNTEQLIDEIERKTERSRLETIDAERPATVVNQMQSLRSSFVPSKSSLTEEGRVISRVNGEKNAVNVKQMIHAIEEKSKFYRSRNIDVEALSTAAK